MNGCATSGYARSKIIGAQRKLSGPCVGLLWNPAAVQRVADMSGMNTCFHMCPPKTYACWCAILIKMRTATSLTVFEFTVYTFYATHSPRCGKPACKRAQTRLRASIDKLSRLQRLALRKAGGCGDGLR